MSSDRAIELVDVLADPSSGAKLRRAREAELKALAEAVERGAAHVAEGALPERIEGAYITDDARVAFVDDASGFPSLLLERRITLDEAL